MKKITILTVALIVAAVTQAQEKRDTTLFFNRKMIQIQDSVKQVRIRVLDKDSNEYKKVYEGIFTDTKTQEIYNVVAEIGFNVPFLKKKKHKHDMDAHYAGLGFGFLNMMDANGKIGQASNVPLDKGKSTEITFNILEGVLPVCGNWLGLSTGFGLDWRNFHLENNTHFLEENGVTAVYPAPAGITYKYSRLRTLHLTLPLQIEFQPNFGNNHKSFITLGVVGGWNVMSTYRVKYANDQNKTMNYVESRGLKTNPLTLDVLGQIGYSNIGLYVKYSPIGVFQENKGPEMKAVSMGLMFHF